MAKLIEMKEAAAQLGVTPDELNEMRERGEAHGYRDGTSWKFKEDEIRRIADEIKSGGRREDDMGPLSLGDDHDLADEDANEASDESILVSEEELGHSGESTSSTIIGKMGDKAKQNDSDLKLDSTGSSMALFSDAGKGTDMKLVDGVDSDLTIASDIDLDSDVTLVPGGSADSDVSLIPTGKTDLELPAPGKSDVLTGTDMKLKSGSSGGTGVLGQRTSDITIGSSDLDMHVDSGLALADDDDLVLGGSGIGSDVTMGGSDSGINLASPTDSGLSLEEEPVDLAGSSAVSSLELPEDEDALSLDDNLADVDQGAVLKQDEEFLLSPSGDMLSDEADSGSQVIALEESSSAFDLGDAALAGSGPGLLADGSPMDAGFGGIAPMTGPVGVPMSYEAPEAPYSIVLVLWLGTIFISLCLGGMLMTDVVRNMWSWDRASPAVTPIADGIAGFLGGSK